MKKVNTKVEIEFEGKTITVSKRQARKIKRIKDQLAKDEKFQAMTDEEKKGYLKKLFIKIGGIGLGAIGILGAILVAASKGNKTEAEAVLDATDDGEPETDETDDNVNEDEE